MKKGLLIAVLAFLIIPSLAGAFTAPDVWNPTILKGPIVTCTGDGTNNTNACASLCDLIYTVVNITYFGIAFVLWVLSPIFFATSGIMFMMSGANPDMRSTAKKAMTGTLWGVAIVVCGWLIVNTVITFLGISGVGGFNAPLCTS